MKITVMIPAYNEKGNIEKLTERFVKVFKEKLPSLKYEFVFVIQGQDGSKESLLELKKKKKLKNMKVIYYPNPIGVGPAHIAGFKNVSKDSDCVVTMDGDLNHLPEEFPSFVEKMKKTNASVVIGSRKVKGAGMEKYSLFKIIMSNIANMVFIILLGVKVKDLTSGYRFMKTDVLRKVVPKIKARNHEFYPEFLLWANKFGFKIVETPIHFKQREHGKSKLRWIPSAFGYVKLLCKAIFIRIR